MTLLPTRMIAAATLMGVLILRVIVTLILRVTVVILHPMKKVLTRFVPKRQPKQRKRPRPQLLRLPLGSLLRRTGKASRLKLIWGLMEHKPKVQERRSEGSMISSGERWHTNMEELWLTIVTRVLLEGMDSGLEQVKSCYKFRENASSMRRLR